MSEFKQPYLLNPEDIFFNFSVDPIFQTYDVSLNNVKLQKNDVEIVNGSKITLSRSGLL